MTYVTDHKKTERLLYSHYINLKWSFSPFHLGLSVPFTNISVHLWSNIALISLFIHSRGGFFSVYGLNRILFLRLWTVEETFSLFKYFNGSLSVNILI